MIRNLSDSLFAYRKSINNKWNNNAGVQWFNRFLNEISSQNNGIINDEIISTLHSFTNTLVSRNENILANIDNLTQCDNCGEKYKFKLMRRPSCCSICGINWCNRCINTNIQLIDIFACAFGINDDEEKMLLYNKLKAYEIEDNNNNSNISKTRKRTNSFSINYLRSTKKYNISICNNCNIWTNVYLFQSFVKAFRHPIEIIYQQLINLLPIIQRHIQSFEAQVELIDDDPDLSQHIKEAVQISCDALENELSPQFSKLFNILDELKDEENRSSHDRNLQENLYDKDVIRHMIKWVFNFLKDYRQRYKQCRMKLKQLK